MNEITLAPRTVCSPKEEYLVYLGHWKALARSKRRTREDCPLHCLLLGKPVGRALPLPGNTSSALANGQAPVCAWALNALLALNPAVSMAERLGRRRRQVDAGSFQ